MSYAVNRLNDLLVSVVEEALKAVNEDNVVEKVTRAIEQRLEGHYAYGKNSFGPQLQDQILKKVTDRYVEENYDEIIKNIDMDVINRAINLNIAKKFSEKL
jgi:hypothetical protein